MYFPEIPNNSLKERLEEIIFIAKAAVNSDVYEEELLTFEFNPPVSESDLSEFEKELDLKLDDEYKDFLRFTNGAILCFNTAEFYSIETIKELNKQEKEANFPEDYIIIADVVGDGEILCYSKNSNKFITCFEGEEEVYDSFSSFLDEVIEFIRDKVDECVGLYE